MPKLRFTIRDVTRYEDARDVPSYTIAEAAQYLSIPFSTLKAWVKGTSYTDASGDKKLFRQVIDLPDKADSLLSFFNLAEAQVLRSLRTIHKVRMQHIRKALKYVQRECGWERPLIQEAFQTDGASLFVERLGKLVDASSSGQVVMYDIVRAHLERLDWEEELAARVYPFTRLDMKGSSPRAVVIDPNRSFGRPILDTVGVTTGVIAERYKAGDSITKLVREYGGPQSAIEEAIRCELQIGVAA